MSSFRRAPRGRISAVEAAARLGVKKATLYAYVSRGVLRRYLSDDGRRSEFDAAEIDELVRRGRPRRSSRDPNLEIEIASSITRIPDGPSQRFGHEYRGHRAVDLARRCTFEEVAHLLVSETLAPVAIPSLAQPRGAAANGSGVIALQAAVVRAAADDPMRSDLGADSVAQSAWRVIGSQVSVVHSMARRDQMTATADASVAERLARGLHRGSRVPKWVIDAVNSALILIADHELAPSTLAARVAASTRADPYACVIAALSTLSGPWHGGASAVVRAALRSSDPVAALAASASGGVWPGFGHRLYDGIDPRARVLIELLQRDAAAHPAVRAGMDLARAVRRRSGVQPNVDLGLAMLVEAGGLEAEAGGVLFAIGRSAGWLAHIREEYDARPVRFRPRAIATGG